MMPIIHCVYMSENKKHKKLVFYECHKSYLIYPTDVKNKIIHNKKQEISKICSNDKLGEKIRVALLYSKGTDHEDTD